MQHAIPPTMKTYKTISFSLNVNEMRVVMSMRLRCSKFTADISKEPTKTKKLKLKFSWLQLSNSSSAAWLFFFLCKCMMFYLWVIFIDHSQTKNQNVKNTYTDREIACRDHHTLNFTEFLCSAYLSEEYHELDVHLTMFEYQFFNFLLLAGF